MSKFEKLEKFKLMDNLNKNAQMFGGQQTYKNVYITVDTVVYKNPTNPGSGSTVTKDQQWDHLEKD